MKTLLTIPILCITVLMAGCIQISDKAARVSYVGEKRQLPKSFIVIGDTEFEGELTASCAEYGINIKPIAVRQTVAELESPTRLVKYKEAGFRYALKLSVRHDYGRVCVFSGNHFVDVTMMVIDIGTNDTIMVIRQSGALGECPPMKPIWELLAKELASRI